jgi:hypothetical protein
LKDRAEALGTVSDECGRDIGFEVVEFLIDSGERDGNGILVHQIGFSDGGSAFQCNIEHEGHERGKEQRPLVLDFGGVVKEFVEFFGGEESLEDGSQTDGGGGVVDEGFYFFSEVEHGESVRGVGEGELSPSSSLKRGMVAKTTNRGYGNYLERDGL